MAMTPYGLLTLATMNGGGGTETLPTKDELDSFQRVWAYLQLNGCNINTPQPQVRRAVDTFNELVDPTTLPLDPRAFFMNGCNPCGTATGGNKAADLYAAAMSFFAKGAAYYEAETPTETEPPSVAEQLAAIAASIATIETSITNLQGRVTVLEAAP